MIMLQDKKLDHLYKESIVFIVLKMRFFMTGTDALCNYSVNNRFFSVAPAIRDWAFTVRAVSTN